MVRPTSGCLLLAGLLLTACGSNDDATGSGGPSDASVDSGAGGDAGSGTGMAPEGGSGGTLDGGAGDGGALGASAGSRLHPIYERLTLADGTERLRFLDVMQDTMRNESCEAQVMTDGKVHCAPLGESIALDPSSYFADATCTSPVIAASHEATSTYGQNCGNLYAPEGNRYFRVTPNGSCGAVQLVAFPTTAPLASTQLFQKTGATCAPATLDSRDVYEVYQATLPLQTVDPSSFELVTQTQPASAGTSRLRSARVVNTGADGSSWVLDDRLDDTQRNEFCYPSTAADGQMRCVPNAQSVSVFTGTYATSSCTGAAPWSLAQNRPCSTDARNTSSQYMTQGTTTPAGCGGAYQYFPVFTDAPVDAVYYGTPASCSVEDHSSATSYQYYADPSLPAPIDPTQFAAITAADGPAAADYGTSGSRLALRTLHYSTADGFSDGVLSAGLYDSTLKTSCFPMDLGDGHLYCAPSVGYFDYSKTRGNLFTDAACTSSVYGVTYAPAACGGGAPAAGAIFADTAFAVAGCEAETFYRVPATPLTLTTLYGASNGVACAPIAVPASTAFYRASDLTAITGSDLVAVSSIALETH